MSEQKQEDKWYQENKKKGFLDSVQEKVVSRKLLVFLTATGLMAWSLLDPETWGMIAIVYIGGQSVVDTVRMYKHGA
jgi:hypothetical protein